MKKILSLLLTAALLLSLTACGRDNGGGNQPPAQGTVTPSQKDTPPESDDPVQENDDPVQENDPPEQNEADPADIALPLDKYYSYTCDGASGVVYFAEYRGDGSFAFIMQGCYTPEELLAQEPWSYGSLEDIYNDTTLEWMNLDGTDYLLWVGNADIVTAEYSYDPATGSVTILGGFSGWDEYVNRTFMPVP